MFIRASFDYYQVGFSVSLNDLDIVSRPPFAVNLGICLYFSKFLLMQSK